MPSTRIAALGLCLALAGCEAPQMPVESRISVVAQESRYEITVPSSKVTLLVPKADLRPGVGARSGASGSPRYFLLEGQELVVSGWFEPARLHTGTLDDSLKGEFAGLVKAGFAAPSHLEKLRVGAFDGVLYDVNDPGTNSSHVRATFVDEDTWIDLHVSVHADRSPAQLRAAVVDAVRGLSIRPKS